MSQVKRNTTSFQKGTTRLVEKVLLLLVLHFLTCLFGLSCSICANGISFSVGCDIIINKDKGVSRIHAELTLDSTAVSTSRRNKSFVIRVKDCSKYGTFVKTDLGTNDKVHELPNKEKILRDGDIITFGTGAATYRYSWLLNLMFLVVFSCNVMAYIRSYFKLKSLQVVCISSGVLHLPFL